MDRGRVFALVVPLVQGFAQPDQAMTAATIEPPGAVEWASGVGLIDVVSTDSAYRASRAALEAVPSASPSFRSISRSKLKVRLNS